MSTPCLADPLVSTATLLSKEVRILDIFAYGIDFNNDTVKNHE